MAGLRDADVQIEPGPLLTLGLPRRLRTVRATLPARPGVRLPIGGLRIVHLSDLHLRRHVPPGLLALGDTLRGDPPDLVCITGDFADDKLCATRQMPVIEKALHALRDTAKLGLFGVVGNHDGDLVAARLQALGVVPLHGRRVRVERDDVVVDLLGLPGTARGEWQGVSRITRDPSIPLVVLGHYPDEHRRVLGLSPELYLAGHTHGGQICLPSLRGGLRPIFTHDSLPKQQSVGIHRVGTGWLCVSRGVGTTRLHVRLGSPAEVLDLRLVPAPAKPADCSLRA